MTKNPYELTCRLRDSMKGSTLICFFFERVNTKEKPFVFVITPAISSHENYRGMFAMFTMPFKGLEHVN